MFWPSETRTSTCRNFATISSGLYRFLAIAVLLDVKDIPQVGPLQRGRIIMVGAILDEASFAARLEKAVQRTERVRNGQAIMNGMKLIEAKPEPFRRRI